MWTTSDIMFFVTKKQKRIDENQKNIRKKLVSLLKTHDKIFKYPQFKFDQHAKMLEILKEITVMVQQDQKNEQGQSTSVSEAHFVKRKIDAEEAAESSFDSKRIRIEDQEKQVVQETEDNEEKQVVQETEHNEEKQVVQETEHNEKKHEESKSDIFDFMEMDDRIMWYFENVSKLPSLINLFQDENVIKDTNKVSTCLDHGLDKWLNDNFSDLSAITTDKKVIDFQNLLENYTLDDLVLLVVSQYS